MLREVDIPLQLGEPITGSFSVATALAPNLSDVTLETDGVGSLTAFNFSDGVFNYGLHSGDGATVVVSTGATGQITQWAVSENICVPAGTCASPHPVPSPFFATQNGFSNGFCVSGSPCVDDFAGDDLGFGVAYAYNLHMPGKWPG